MRRHEKAPQRAQRTGGLSNGAPLNGLTAHFRPFASGGPYSGMCAPRCSPMSMTRGSLFLSKGI
jgi:hypothetical protein